VQPQPELHLQTQSCVVAVGVASVLESDSEMCGPLTKRECTHTHSDSCGNSTSSGISNGYSSRSRGTTWPPTFLFILFIVIFKCIYSILIQRNHRYQRYHRFC